MQRRKKNKPPDVMFYSYSEILEKENQVLEKIRKKHLSDLGCIKKTNQQIQINEQELAGIRFRERNSPKKIADRIDLLESEIKVFKKALSASKGYAYSEEQIQMFIQEREAFISSLRNKKQRGGTVKNTATDLNFYLDETLAKKAIENLIAKGFSPQYFL